MADANLQSEKNGSGELLTLLAGGNKVERRPADFGDEEEDDEDVEGEEEESEDEIEGIERSELASDSDREEADDFDANEMDGKLLEIEQELEGKNSSGDEDDAEDELNFKNEMHKRASNSFFARQSSSVNLKSLVYDTDPTKLAENTEKSEVGDFFVKIMEKTTEIDDKDVTRAPFVATNALDDEDNILARVENLAAMIKDSFVTGDWGEEDAEKLLKEDDELHGDFEDLEKEFDGDHGNKNYIL